MGRGAGALVSQRELCLSCPRNRHPSSPGEQRAPSHPHLPHHSPWLGVHQALHPVFGGSRQPFQPPGWGLPSGRVPPLSGPAGPRSTRKVPSELSFSLKTNAFSRLVSNLKRPGSSPPHTPTVLAAGQVPEKRQQSRGTSCVPGRRSRRCRRRLLFLLLLLLLLARRRPHASLRAREAEGAKGTGQRLLLRPPALAEAKGESPARPPPAPEGRAGPDGAPSPDPPPGCPLGSEDLRFFRKSQAGSGGGWSGIPPAVLPMVLAGPGFTSPELESCSFPGSGRVWSSLEEQSEVAPSLRKESDVGVPDPFLAGLCSVSPTRRTKQEKKTPMFACFLPRCS